MFAPFSSSPFHPLINRLVTAGFCNLLASYYSWCNGLPGMQEFRVLLLVWVNMILLEFPSYIIFPLKQCVFYLCSLKYCQFICNSNVNYLFILFSTFYFIFVYPFPVFIYFLFMYYFSL